MEKYRFGFNTLMVFYFSRLLNFNFYKRNTLTFANLMN